VAGEKEKAEKLQKEVLEQVKTLPPEEQDKIFQQSQQAISQPTPTAAATEVAAAEAAQGTKLLAEQQNEQSKALEFISKQLDEKKIMGIPQSKFLMIVGGFAFFLLFIVILLK